jgi:hypothetical protein
MSGVGQLRDHILQQTIQWFRQYDKESGPWNKMLHTNVTEPHYICGLTNGRVSSVYEARADIVPAASATATAMPAVAGTAQAGHAGTAGHAGPQKAAFRWHMRPVDQSFAHKCRNLPSCRISCANKRAGAIPCTQKYTVVETPEDLWTYCEAQETRARGAYSRDDRLAHARSASEFTAASSNEDSDSSEDQAVQGVHGVHGVHGAQSAHSTQSTLRPPKRPHIQFAPEPRVQTFEVGS